MTRRNSLATLLLSLGFLTTVLSPTGADAVEPLAKDISWAENLDAARRKALQFDRPMLIVFGAEWCGYCKKLEKTTLSDPRMVSTINSRFVPVHLDYDEQKKIAKILEVESLPCSIVLSPEADLLGRIKGYKGSSDYFRLLTEAENLQARIRQASASTSATR